MIDHVSVGVSDLERAARFYEAALAPLGLSRLVTRPATVGFGKTYPEFWINLRAGMAPVAPDERRAISACARNRRRVERRLLFTRLATSAFGDALPPVLADGAPAAPHDRVRTSGVIVLDSRGNRIEAVTFPAGRTCSRSSDRWVAA